VRAAAAGALLVAGMIVGAVASHAAVASPVAPASGPPTAPPGLASPRTAVCARSAAAAPALDRLRTALAEGRFVAYGPTSLQVHDGRVTPAERDSVREDLRVLRTRFDSIVTYSAVNGSEVIPDVAAELGFRAMIVGVWDPFDAREVQAAVQAAARHPRLVVGVSLGNELVFAKRRGLAELPARVAAIRAQAPTLPLATTEPFHVYYEPVAQALLRELDFVLLNVHPVFQPWWREAPDRNGAEFVVGATREIRARYCGPVLVKETGVPTAPAEDGFTEQRQASFYRELRRQFASSPDAAFAYFSAFDAPWRVADEQAVAGHHPEEAHWGLYREDRRPKPAALEVPPQAEKLERHVREQAARGD
jgi:exo-beta-1,3-glucanase (GH17 family)